MDITTTIKTKNGYYMQKSALDYVDVEICQGKSWLYDRISMDSIVLAKSGLLQLGIGNIGKWSLSIDKENNSLHIEVKNAENEITYVLTDVIHSN